MTDTPTGDEASSSPSPDDREKNGRRGSSRDKRDPLPDDQGHETAEERAIRFRTFLAIQIARRILQERRGLPGPDDGPRR